MDSADFIGYKDDFEDEKIFESYAELANENLDADTKEEELPSSMKPIVRNLLVSAEYGVEFDLFSIAQKVRNAEYNPRRIQAAVIRIDEPHATALIYKVGKMVIGGTKTRDVALLAARKFGKIMKRLGYKVHLQNFQIISMVATASCNFRVGLESIASQSRQFTKYNPEVFAGLIFKIPQPKLTMLIFASGKIIFTGAKTLEELDQAAQWIMPYLQLNEKTNVMSVEEFQAKVEQQKNEEQEKTRLEQEQIREAELAHKKAVKLKKNDPFRRKPRT